MNITVTKMLQYRTYILWFPEQNEEQIWSSEYENSYQDATIPNSPTIIARVG